jgi:hypothetical protein
MSQDIVAALITVLKADAAVAALVGARVFGLELPASEAKSMPRKAVVLRAAGGPSLAAGSYIEHDSQRIDLFAWGETPYEAERTRRACFDALKFIKRQVAASTLIHWVEPAGGFATQRDPDAAWPVAFQSYQAFFATPAAA